MNITKKQAEDFVHFGEDHYLNFKMLKDMNYLYWGAAWLLWVPYVVAGRGLVPCVILTLLALIYNIAFCILKSKLVKKTYRLRFLTNTISYSYLYLIAYLFTIFFINASDVGITLRQSIELTLCFVAFPILNIIFTLRAIKKNAFSKEKPKKSVGAVGWSIGAGLVGMSLGRIFDPYLSQKQAVVLVIFIVELLLLLFSLATHNILRVYFACKYNIVASVEGETVSEALVYDYSKNKLGILILKIILKVFVAIVAIVMLYGINKVS